MNFEAPENYEQAMDAQKSELLHYMKDLTEEKHDGIPIQIEIDEDEKVAEYELNGKEIYIHYRLKKSENGELFGMVQVHEKGPSGKIIRTFEYHPDAKVWLYEITEGKDYGKEAKGNEATLNELMELNLQLVAIYKKRKNFASRSRAANGERADLPELNS